MMLPAATCCSRPNNAWGGARMDLRLDALHPPLGLLGLLCAWLVPLLCFGHGMSWWPECARFALASAAVSTLPAPHVCTPQQQPCQLQVCSCSITLLPCACGWAMSACCHTCIILVTADPAT